MIRGLGVVVVDADRSETSRAFVEQVAVSPDSGRSSSAWPTLPRRRARSGQGKRSPPFTSRSISSAISRPRRRPQIVAFYNQQYLTAAGIASQGMSDTLASAVR